MNAPSEEKNPYRSPDSLDRPLPKAVRRTVTELELNISLAFIAVGTLLTAICVYLLVMEFVFDLRLGRFENHVVRIFGCGAAGLVCLFIAWLLRRGRLIKELPPDPTRRPPTDDERGLVLAMLRAVYASPRLQQQAETMLVKSADEAGTGSCKLFPPAASSGPRTTGEEIADLEFTDADGVTCSCTLNLDTDGHLFELEMWKVGFVPLVRWPQPENLRPAGSNDKGDDEEAGDEDVDNVGRHNEAPDDEDE